MMPALRALRCLWPSDSRYFARVRRVLKLPAYRRLLGAYTLNELAFSIGSVALALLVYRRTGSALGATAFFLCSQFFPALVAPMVVARLDRRAPREVLPSLYARKGSPFGRLPVGSTADRPPCPVACEPLGMFQNRLFGASAKWLFRRGRDSPARPYAPES